MKRLELLDKARAEHLEIITVARIKGWIAIFLSSQDRGKASPVQGAEVLARGREVACFPSYLLDAISGDISIRIHDAMSRRHGILFTPPEIVGVDRVDLEIDYALHLIACAAYFSHATRSGLQCPAREVRALAGVDLPRDEILHATYAASVGDKSRFESLGADVACDASRIADFFQVA